MKAEPGGRMAAAIQPLVNSQTVRLEQLFWEHHDRVLRAAYRITGNMTDAEDVAQTVFVRLAGATESIANVESYLPRGNQRSARRGTTAET